MTLDHSRRRFIADLGKGLFAVAIFGGWAAACSSSDSASTTTTRAAGTTLGTTTTRATTTSQGTTTSEGTSMTTAPTAGDATAIARVSLGFVSAYVVARGTEAAVVDTGVGGSEQAIEVVLAELGLGWDAVGHVILTHLHPDHIGSLGAVMGAATDATGYAGAADIPGIGSPRPLTAVGDGDSVFGLDIIATPGHTAGHISVRDPINGAGAGLDAPAGLAGPNPRFTSDMDEAIASVRKLAAEDIDAIYFGHGEPLIGGAGAALQALAADL